jgi:hypothetical protein
MDGSRWGEVSGQYLEEGEGRIMWLDAPDECDDIKVDDDGKFVLKLVVSSRSDLTGILEPSGFLDTDSIADIRNACSVKDILVAVKDQNLTFPEEEADSDTPGIVGILGLEEEEIGKHWELVEHLYRAKDWHDYGEVDYESLAEMLCDNCNGYGSFRCGHPGGDETNPCQDCNGSGWGSESGLVAMLCEAGKIHLSAGRIASESDADHIHRETWDR